MEKKIAEIIKNGVTYSPQTDSVIIHGAIEAIIESHKEYANQQLREFKEQLKRLCEDFEKYRDEYKVETDSGKPNWDYYYFKGKQDAYSFAAKKVKDAMNWLGIIDTPHP